MSRNDVASTDSENRTDRLEFDLGHGRGLGLYDRDGSCLEQPYEDTQDPSGRLRETINIKSYPVEAKAGLLWAYLGPEPAPMVPSWEPFTWENGFVQIVFSEIP